MSDTIQALLTYPSTSTPAATTNLPFSCAQHTLFAVDVSFTAFTGGTAPSVQFFIDRQGTDGVWYQIFAGAVLTAPGLTSTSIGHGLVTAQAPTGTCRLRWVLAGTVAATAVTFSASVTGR